jgi:hypothetical protein
MTTLAQQLNDVDGIDELAYATRLYRVLTSIWYTNSFDVKVVSEDVYKYYEGKIEIEDVTEVVEFFINVIKEDEDLVEDGKLTEVSNNIAASHFKTFAPKPITYN